MPTQVAAATQTPSESVTSNKRSATAPPTTTTMTTSTNKGKKARYQVRPQPPSSAPQSGSNNTPASNSVAQSDVASSSKNNFSVVFCSILGVILTENILIYLNLLNRQNNKLYFQDSPLLLENHMVAMQTFHMASM